MSQPTDPQGERQSPKQDVFLKHECPRNGHFFEKCNLYIGP